MSAKRLVFTASKTTNQRIACLPGAPPIGECTRRVLPDSGEVLSS